MRKFRGKAARISKPNFRYETGTYAKPTGACLKEIYTTVEAADRAAKAFKMISGIAQYSYPCRVCKFFHLATEKM